jgi:hypothetical protein
VNLQNLIHSSNIDGGLRKWSINLEQERDL